MKHIKGIFRKFRLNKLNLFTFSLWIMLITFGIPFISGCSTDSKIVLTTGFKDGEVFRIEKESCFEYEALIYLACARSQYSEVYGDQIWSTSQNGIYLGDNVKDNVLGQLAKVKMMTLMADDYKVELSDDEIKLMENAGREFYMTLTDGQKEILGNPEVSEVISMYNEYALANKIYQYIIKDVNLEISDDEARTVVLKQIFISNENDSASSLAEEAYKKLVNGTGFDELVMEYSDSTEKEVFYTKNDVPMVFYEPVFNLGKGEFSQVIMGDDGYYIFYCMTPNDMSSTEATKAEIISTRQKEAFAKIYDGYMSNKKYYLNDELWEKISYDENIYGPVIDFFGIYNKYM